MDTKNESLRVRQKDFKSAAKHVAGTYIEKGNFKKVMDLLKFLGKKVTVDKSDISKATYTFEQFRGKLDEKSVSKQQQKFMGMVRAVQKGEMDAPSPEVAQAAKTMKKKDVKDFAKTKHKGLPDKVKEAIDQVNQDFPNTLESLDEATIKDIKDILTTIGSSKNMDQAVQMVMKKYKVDQGKAKAMVKKAIDSGVTYDKIRKKYAKESVELEEGLKTTHVVVDTAQGNKVVATAAGANAEKNLRSSIASAERPPLNIKDKKTLKIVKLKKPVSDKKASQMVGSPLKEEVELDEATRVSRKDFDKLKKGSMITIDYGSGIRGSTKRTFMVKGKSRSAKYNVDKVNMVDPNKPGGMKFHLYSRDGEDATLALGDMGATINSYSIKESVELDEMSREDKIKQTMKIMKKYPANKGKSEQELRKGAIAYLDQKKESVEEKRDAGKSATGYDIYHDTYAAAMQHAYAHAKKKHGVTVRPSEIDDKVALGPKKPSTGKTVSHILKTDKKQNLHVQVYNTGRKYELNMYVESVELEEANAIDLARDVVKNKGAKKGLDMRTANAILTVYNKVNDANKKKMETMPVAKLASAVWKILGKAK